MLSSIELENYRRFGKYRVGSLSRVNLLVGKNNCGNTSVLEAIYLLASGGDPRVFNTIAWQRGEVVVAPEETDRYRRSPDPTVAHFFHGHEMLPDSSFMLRTDSRFGNLTVRILAVNQENQPTLFPMAEDVSSQLVLQLEGTERPETPGSRSIPMTDDGMISRDWLRRATPRRTREREDRTPVRFITPESLSPLLMSDMWDQVITEGQESSVIDALKVLEPEVTNIFFLSGEAVYRSGGGAGVLVAVEGTRRRDPLGSYGEGMRRLLALSLSLAQAEGGILLVDEIDTGLHYSIMGDMWRLIVETARRANVQVFATTHSSDCVRGLSWLCESYPDLRSEVSLQKVEPRLDEAVALDAEGIMMAVDQGMEVR